MVRKSSNHLKSSKTSAVWSLLLWGSVLALTYLRLSVAFSGSIDQSEALLSICALHPAGGYVEGPAGVPLLLALDRTIFGSGIVVIRWISPVAALVLSWALWWIVRHSVPNRPNVALWSVMGVNLLPQFNLASVVMNGSIVTSAIVFVTVVAGWHAVIARSGGIVGVVGAWFFFGVLLGVGTLFFYPLGLALPLALIACVYSSGMKVVSWGGIITAFILLLIGWTGPLLWNVRHDWIQWSSVAAGFDSIHAAGHIFSLGVTVETGVILVPLMVLLAYRGSFWRWPIILGALGLAASSAVILLNPALIPAGLPSPVGVHGINEVARTLVSLRDQRLDERGAKPFLIASTSGLAALLGHAVTIEYPERPGSPAVFVAESPSLNSSFALWPCYADAVAKAVNDPLYTEEKAVSPFLGRNAIYVTTELQDELPQTITGAFQAVGLLQDVPLESNGRLLTLHIYQCEHYRALPL